MTRAPAAERGLVPATAVIAEDEPRLGNWLAARLAERWGELKLLALVEDGLAARERLLSLRPDVCFIDIGLPGMSGIDVIEAMAEEWPPGSTLPLVVFVTAYPDYAVRAFRADSADYLVKPVEPARLDACVARLKARLEERRRGDVAVAQQLEQLRTSIAGLAQATTAGPDVLQLQAGDAIHFVPLDDIVYFEADDKYVRVVTADRDYFMRCTLRELLPRLDPDRFWQIHRGTVVRVLDIAQARRDDTGRLQLRLRRRPEVLHVSRLYGGRFRPG